MLSRHDLVGGNEICERVDEIALQDSLQVPSSVAVVSSLFQQPLLRLLGAPESEVVLGGSRGCNSFLDAREFEVMTMMQLESFT